VILMEAEFAPPPEITEELLTRFGSGVVVPQSSRDEEPTIWVPSERVIEILRYLKLEARLPYLLLFDLTVIDERTRSHREGQPPSDFTIVYQLLRLRGSRHLRIKAALRGDSPSIPSITPLWPSAAWYEREAWDMFGVQFTDHPHLERLLMPRTWEGHPLRKEHPARATEMGPFRMPEDEGDAREEQYRFRPEDWGMTRTSGGTEFMFLNVGPQHPGTHGVLRIILELDGEEITNAVLDIGYHHRGVEKMGERQSWHTFIPYTDRVDYLGGVMNNLPYVLAVERLAGITVPDRAQVIRVMTCELFRIASHLVWYGTFAQDLGQLSPVFYMFTDREKVFRIIEAVCGARMHPSWFRIGGIAQDLPEGWDRLVREFLDYFPPRLNEYDQSVLKNGIFQARTRGIGAYSLDEALDWGVTGPGLRACGLRYDWRKERPYSGYERFEFDVPTGERGDCYDRAVVRVEEMRQSLRIIKQCLDRMPPGEIKARHPLATPPPKERTMRDIETLIAHFLSVSWGPVIPPGEAFQAVEGTKGIQGYYLVSDGGPIAYRLRVRTPCFPHLQMVPLLCRGLLVPDLLAILGSIDFVLGEVDR
jgi:NADH-quinone oxidoreductase subunit C/D